MLIDILEFIKDVIFEVFRWLRSEEFILSLLIFAPLALLGWCVYLSAHTQPAPYIEACGRAIQAEYGNGPLGARMFDELCTTGIWKEGE